MPNLGECASLVAEAAGITKDEARELVEAVDAERARLQDSGRLENAERDLAEYAGRKAEESRINTALQRKHAALNVLKRQELDARILKFEAAADGDSREAILSVLVGSQKRVEGARMSVDARRLGIVDTWLGGMLAELDQRPHLVKTLRDDSGLIEDVVREMYELKAGGRPGITGSADARFAANVFARYAEGARTRLNGAGAFIRKLDGWTPQSHDAGLLLKAGRDQWVDDILPLLDRERTLAGLDDAEVRVVLGEVFENIVTGRDLSVTARERGRFLGPRNLARSMGKSRVLHFRDADAWLQYHGRFGTGNVLTAMLGHLDRSARKLSLMETLGPNPEQMLISLVENARRRVRESGLDAKEQTRRINRLSGDVRGRGGPIGRSFAEVMGETLIAENVSAARLAAGVRAWIAMSKLGGAALSAVADLATVGMNARFNGVNVLEAYGRSFDALLKGTRDADRRQTGYLLGTMYDGMLRTTVARWNAQDSVQGRMGDMLDRFFRLSGLTYWTESLKAGYAQMLSTHLAGFRGRGFAELPEEVRAVLGYHGFDERAWGLLNRMTRKAEDGRRYLMPEAARRLSNADLDAYNATRIEELGKRLKGADLARRVERLRAETRRRFETDAMAMIADETRYAVLEPDARTRAFMTQGTRPGTLLGETLRFVMQFKSFPVTYTQRMLRGRRFQKPGAGADVAGIAQFITTSWVLGYAAMTAKDVSKGRGPRDPRNLETWMAAALQSGGAGIYGDFLLTKYNRFGGGPIDTLAGPVAGTLGEAVTMASGALRGETDAGDALYLAMNNTPYINLWYTRAALDYAVLFHLREMVSPGTLRRTEKRMRKDFGQRYLLPPSKHIKRGGGL